MEHALPPGFAVAGVHCGIKRNPQKPDLTLVVSRRECTAAGVYTRNRVFGAPIAWNRRITPSGEVRAVVINSGNANACTGQRGLEDAQAMAQAAAQRLGCRPEQVLVLSTGIIGQFLPMDKIQRGIALAHQALGTGGEHLRLAALGMMTTDTRPKLASARFATEQGEQIPLCGMAKGAGMIAPNMATMLAVVMTTAALEPPQAQAVLQRAADETFNCLSIDGHTSTSDAVLLLATGESGPLSPADLQCFQAALHQVCEDLARQIADDGEGITHLVQLDVEGCPDRRTARQVAKTVAESVLVKTAIAGGDPNWGRIVSAVGYAGVELPLEELVLEINGVRIYAQGGPCPFDAQALARSMKQQRLVRIRLDFQQGEGRVRFWTTDLTVEYVRFNSQYTT